MATSFDRRRLETAIHLFEALVDLLEPPIDVVQAMVDMLAQRIEGASQHIERSFELRIHGVILLQLVRAQERRVPGRHGRLPSKPRAADGAR
jgi:hypothetical protein